MKLYDTMCRFLFWKMYVNGEHHVLVHMTFNFIQSIRLFHPIDFDWSLFARFGWLFLFTMKYLILFQRIFQSLLNSLKNSLSICIDTTFSFETEFCGKHACECQIWVDLVDFQMDIFWDCAFCQKCQTEYQKNMKTQLK